MYFKTLDKEAVIAVLGIITVSVTQRWHAYLVSKRCNSVSDKERISMIIGDYNIY